jgi:hypothetical protein
MDHTMTKEPKIPDRYLGDGVYASFDGYQIWISLHDGSRIALEPEVIQALLKYQQFIIDKYKGESRE